MWSMVPSSSPAAILAKKDAMSSFTVGDERSRTCPEIRSLADG